MDFSLPPRGPLETDPSDGFDYWPTLRFGDHDDVSTLMDGLGDDLSGLPEYFEDLSGLLNEFDDGGAKDAHEHPSAPEIRVDGVPSHGLAADAAAGAEIGQPASGSRSGVTDSFHRRARPMWLGEMSCLLDMDLMSKWRATNPSPTRAAVPTFPLTWLVQCPRPAHWRATAAAARSSSPWDTLLRRHPLPDRITCISNLPKASSSRTQARTRSEIRVLPPLAPQRRRSHRPNSP